jgi:hypothetical protein
MLSVIYAECRYAECLKWAFYAECRYAECRGAITMHQLLFYSTGPYLPLQACSHAVFSNCTDSDTVVSYECKMFMK